MPSRIPPRPPQAASRRNEPGLGAVAYGTIALFSRVFPAWALILAGFPDYTNACMFAVYRFRPLWPVGR